MKVNKMIKKMLKPKNLFMLGLTLVILYALFSPMSMVEFPAREES